MDCGVLLENDWSLSKKNSRELVYKKEIQWREVDERKKNKKFTCHLASDNFVVTLKVIFQWMFTHSLLSIIDRLYIIEKKLLSAFRWKKGSL